MQDPLPPNSTSISASLLGVRDFAGVARLVVGPLMYVCALGSVLTPFHICSDRQATRDCH